MKLGGGDYTRDGSVLIPYIYEMPKFSASNVRAYLLCGPNLKPPEYLLFLVFYYG